MLNKLALAAYRAGQAGLAEAVDNVGFGERFSASGFGRVAPAAAASQFSG